TAAGGVDCAKTPLVRVGDQGQQFVTLCRAKLERPHVALAGAQISDTLDDGPEVVPLDAMAGALVGIEIQVEYSAVEKAPAAVERLGDEDRLSAALGELEVELAKVKGDLKLGGREERGFAGW